MEPNHGRKGGVAFALATVFGALAASCGGSASPPPQTKAQATQPAQQAAAAKQAQQAEVSAQRDAQRAWCVYLEALYVRAAEGATGWPRFEQCTQATTTASPKLLHRTADCSLRALQQYEGDPFTAEYASEVSRCGAEALDSMVVTRRDLAPFVAAICGRISTCGDVTFAECRENLEVGLGDHLERAIGAMNTGGRQQLQSCLQTVTCDELGHQITACIEPVMDALLWLPG